MSKKTGHNQNLWIWKEITVSSFRVEYLSDNSLEILRKSVKGINQDICSPNQQSNQQLLPVPTNIKRLKHQSTWTGTIQYV